MFDGFKRRITVISMPQINDFYTKFTDFFLSACYSSLTSAPCNSMCMTLLVFWLNLQMKSTQNERVNTDFSLIFPCSYF